MKCHIVVKMNDVIVKLRKKTIGLSEVLKSLLR